MMMNKQNLFTAMGIALSFIIAIGGWVLTNTLIERKSDALLSTKGITPVNAPSAPIRADLNPNINSEDYIRPQLTKQEILSVLQNWETPGRERLHEPIEGQLNMEQAIDAGKSGLFYLYEQGVIPVEPMGYDKINAYLYENQPSGQETQSLDPFYSYWKISLDSESMSVTLTINAVTGEIWKAEIVPTIPDFNFKEIETEQILRAFVSYLGLGTGDTFELDGTKVSQGFNGGLFNAVVQKRGVQINNEAPTTMVYIYLSQKTSK